MSWIVTQLEICGLNAILALSVYATLKVGQFSLAQVGFMSIGAYLTGMLILFWGLPLLPALLISAALASIIGVALGYPCLRIRGIYLALATIAFAEVVRVFFHNFVFLKEVNGVIVGPDGSMGFRGIPVLTSWPQILVSLLIIVAVFAWLERSRFGLTTDAIQQDETAAESSGINVVSVKVAVFAFGAAVAAIAGGLYGTFTSFVISEHFGFHLALISVFYVAIGGTRTFMGPIFGAVLLTVLPEMLRFAGDYRMVIYGLLVLAVMVVAPNGLEDLLPRVLRKLRRAQSGGSAPHDADQGANT